MDRSAVRAYVIPVIRPYDVKEAENIQCPSRVFKSESQD